MPTSDADGKPWALDRYLTIRPATVVDIGAGNGTYARLMRPHHRADWTAIEAWEPYIERYGLRTLYDRVALADARHLDWPDYRADLVIAGDVLEHMTRGDATALLRRITYAAANLLVSVPLLHLPQGAVNGNPYETHVDHWTHPQMLAALNALPGGKVRGSYQGPVLGYYWWQRAQNLEA